MKEKQMMPKKKGKNRGAVKMRRIAIIGMGVAGISVLRAIAKHPSYQDDQIVVYNPPKTFGTGLPYQEDSEELLINQTADTMSLESDDSLDFVHWVTNKKGILNGEKSFFPRTWYGEYMKDKLDSAIQRVQPTIIQEEVITLRVQKAGTYIIQSPSSLEQYDSVHLCLGHLPYQDPYDLIGNERYIHHPYPAQEKLVHFPEDARIGIIGTGLTSIDLMRFLKKNNPQRNIHFFSRRVGFSLYRGFEPEITLRHLTIKNIQKEQMQHNGFVPLEKMVEWFYLECRDKGVDFDSLNHRFGQGTQEELNAQLQEKTDLGVLQAIIHHMDSHLADFMQSLTEVDKQRFYAEFEPMFKHFRAPMPKASLEKLMEEWNAQRITVCGDMREVETTASGFKVQFGNEESAEVDYLINATGHNMNVQITPYQSTLMNQLLNERILQPELFGGVQVIWPSAQAITQRYGVLNRLYVHGQLIQGVQYGNNAHLLMKQAEQVVAEDARN